MSRQRRPFKHRVPRKPKAKIVEAVETAAIDDLVGMPKFPRAEVLAWKTKLDAYEEEIIADARLAGCLPIVDYTEAPFEIPDGMQEAIRELTSPEGRERRYRFGLTARREAAKRRGLAAMLREKGDVSGAEMQEAAALKYARVAAEAGAADEPAATEAPE